MDYVEKIEYLKKSVLQMLQERNDNFTKNDSQIPGTIWSEALCLFEYIVNLSAENFLNIRLHTGPITGSNVLQCWHPYPPFDPEKFANNTGYKFYTQNIPQDYWISEPPLPNIPRPMGVNYRGRIINVDICRYQSCITNLYLMGILESLKGNRGGNLILEVGGGYGGLAHQLGNILAGNSTYIILDLPEMLLFSGGFLMVNNPRKNIYIYEKSTFTAEFLNSGIYEYDYVLLPNYLLADLYALREISLMLNMQSFQEMTANQIEEYLQFGRSKLTGYLYSDNIDRHPCNEEIAPETVTTVLERHYNLLPMPEFYKKIIGKNNPWLYKCYAGVPKGKSVILTDGLSIKYISWPVRYSVTYNKGNIKCRSERALLGYIIMLGIRLLQGVFKL